MPNIGPWVPYILLHMQIHSRAHTGVCTKYMTHTCRVELAYNKRKRGREEPNGTTEVLEDRL